MSEHDEAPDASYLSSLLLLLLLLFDDADADDDDDADADADDDVNGTLDPDADEADETASPASSC